MSESKRIRTREELEQVLADRRSHEFKLLLMPGVFSRRTLRMFKSGQIGVENHVDGTRYTMTMDKLLSGAENIHFFMERGNFVLDE